MLEEDRRGEDLGVGDHRADDDLIALDPDPAQFVEIIDVDEDVGPGEP